jgi:hypothetical protein
MWIGQDEKGKWYIGKLETDGEKKYIVSTADKQRHEVQRGTLRTYP